MTVMLTLPILKSGVDTGKVALLCSKSSVLVAFLLGFNGLEVEAASGSELGGGSSDSFGSGVEVGEEPGSWIDWETLGNAQQDSLPFSS